eukprot:gene8096-8931_t
MTRVHRETSLLASEDWLPSIEIFGDLFSDSVKPLDGPPPFEAQLHGTTTMSFKHQDSVIICVDSKASLGNYVGSRTVKKIFPISSTVVATMAGGAADCAHLIGRVRENAKLLERQYSVSLGVQGMAKLLANVLRRNRGLGLSVGTMVAGCDEKGPSICYVDSEGCCIEGEMFCVGSGSQSAYSVLDSSPPLSTLPLEEAIDTAIWAVRHATLRDGYSGGYINVVRVNATGIYPLRRVDCRKLKIPLKSQSSLLN